MHEIPLKLYETVPVSNSGQPGLPWLEGESDNLMGVFNPVCHPVLKILNYPVTLDHGEVVYPVYLINTWKDHTAKPKYHHLANAGIYDPGGVLFKPGEPLPTHELKISARAEATVNYYEPKG